MDKPAENINSKEDPESVFHAEKKSASTEIDNLLKDNERNKKQNVQKDDDFLFPIKTLFD